MDVELLNVRRAAQFIEYSMVHDLQVKVNRSAASSMLYSSIARPGEIEVIRFSSEKFDKICTYLDSNDQQVHYASAANTVGTYAITRLLGELRRTLRDYQLLSEGAVLPMESPRVFTRSAPQSAQRAAGLGGGFQLIPGKDLENRGKAAGPSGLAVQTDRTDVSGEGSLGQDQA